MREIYLPPDADPEEFLRADEHVFCVLANGGCPQLTTYSAEDGLFKEDRLRFRRQNRRRRQDERDNLIL